MMWFSAVYADPEKVAFPFQSQPRTLYDILWGVRRETFGDGRDQRAWSTSQLIKSCRAQGLKMVGQDETEDFWVVGKRSAGYKGFEPLWEQARPPRLRMMEQIKGKSLDELEDLMSGFSRDSAGDADQDGAADISSHEASHEAEGGDDDQSPDRPTGTGRSIFAHFARRSRNGGGRRSVVVEAGNPAVSVSPGHLNSTGSGIMARFARRPQPDGGRGIVFDEAGSTSMARSSGSEFIPSTVGESRIQIACRT
jgi:hypothetical protein